MGVSVDGEMSVIVWVNGAFGIGKSALVDEMRPRWPDALVYDPEMVGRSFTPDDPEQYERVRRWCKSKIQSCMAAVDTLPSDTVFLDGELSPQELADDVLARVGAVAGAQA